MTTALATPTAQFAKWSNRWAVRVPNELAADGAVVIVRKRDGEEKKVTVTGIIREFDDNSICEFEDMPPHPAARRRPARGWSNARRYRYGQRRECPICGEMEGDMYRNGVCDECGWHD